MSSPNRSGGAPARTAGGADRSARISADRLGSTLFLAGLAHGVLILGVTFTSWPSAEGDELPSLNVTLVVERHPTDAPPESEWLAQTNIEGGGAAPEGLRPTTTLAAEEPSTIFGDPTALDTSDGRPRETALAAEEILTRGPSERQIAALPKAAEAAAAEIETRAALLDRMAPETLAAEIDDRAALPESDETDGPPAPTARESALAAYLDSWRRRVERIGTLNFPATLRPRDGVDRPLLEVAIDANGQLTDIVVRRSSGDGALDQAALTILRLAAPFEPLPDEITSEHNVLRFAYEWDFSGSASGASASAAASPAPN